MHVDSGSNVRRGLGPVHGADAGELEDGVSDVPQREASVADGIEANEIQGRAGKALLEGKSGSSSSFELNLPYDPYEPELGEKAWKDIPFMLDGAAGEAMAQLSANMNASQQSGGNENPIQLAAMGDQAPDVKASAEIRESDRKSLDINDTLSSQRVQGLRGTTAGRY